MPPVSTPAADSIVAGVDVLSVGDDLRATVFRYIGHFLPQLLHFLVFGLLGHARHSRCTRSPLRKRRSPR